MAWVAITNNPNWQYNNSPEDPGAGSPLRALWLKQTNGIRTIGSGAGAHQVYSEVRRVGDTTNRSRGELSKSYWDAREGTLSSYAVNNFDPKLVFDFTGNVFKTGGVASTLANSVTHARAGQATMVDSDGLIKWAPHNLFKSSENYNLNGWYRNQYTVTPNNDIAPDGTTTANLVSTTDVSASYLMDDGTAFTNIGNYTIKFWAKANTGVSTLRIWTWMLGGSAGSSGQTTFNLTNEWQLLEINPTITTAGQPRIRIDQPGTGASSFYLWGAHAYRSNLGGMVNNPSQPTGFETYVPTTSSPVYLPRLGHHIYNGSAWVNEGILHESEARTNLVPYSQDFSNAYWKFVVSPTITSNATTAPDGTTTADRVAADRVATNNGSFQDSTAVPTGGCVSVFAKADTVDWLAFGEVNDCWAYFDLANGVTGNKSAAVGSTSITDYGNGWYLCQAYDITTRWDRVLLSPKPTEGNGDPWSNVMNSIGDSVFLWGAQIEAGPRTSSYIPTSGSQVTRAAETLTVPAANLPWPTAVAIGPELVTNGTFDANDFTGWVVFNDPDADASSGAANIGKLSGDAAEIRQELTVVSGRVYKVEFDITSVTGSSLVQLRDGTGQLWQETITAPTSVVVYYTETTTQLGLNIRSRTDGVRITIDNISVKEIDPVALSIQIDGKMTYADDDGNNHTVLPWRWRLDSSNILYNTFSTAGTRTGQPRFIQSQTTSGVDEILGANNVYTPDVNVPFNLAGHYGSTFINGAHEGTLLTANTTPTALPDLSSTNLELGYIFMGTIGKFRMWDEDLTDAGIVEATEPSTEPSLQLTFDGSSTNSFTVLDWSE